LVTTQGAIKKQCLKMIENENKHIILVNKKLHYLLDVKT